MVNYFWTYDDYAEGAIEIRPGKFTLRHDRMLSRQTSLAGPRRNQYAVAAFSLFQWRRVAKPLPAGKFYLFG